ncbi:MAG: hypothetical protein EXX96DRAFT_566212 [Benjaminiella poitrasii]|nr:MAG: hypothetical protein EXX96DRAFT_566212 [Benjaminiella poitrasii]
MYSTNNNKNSNSMLLVQPLNINEINIKIVDDTINDQQQQGKPVTPIDVIDDAELLAILGLPSPNTSTTAIPVLDWDDDDMIPELLSESEEEDNNTVTTTSSNSSKRKRNDGDDLFAQFDFEEVTLLYPSDNNKKQKLFVEESNEITNQLNDFIQQQQQQKD